MLLGDPSRTAWHGLVRSFFSQNHLVHVRRHVQVLLHRTVSFHDRMIRFDDTKLARQLGSRPYQDRYIPHGLMTQTKQTGPPNRRGRRGPARLPAWDRGRLPRGEELPKKKWCACACALPGASPCVPAAPSSVPFRGAPASKGTRHPRQRRERGL